MTYTLYKLVVPKHSEEFSLKVMSGELSETLEALLDESEKDVAHQDSISPYESWYVGYAIVTSKQDSVAIFSTDAKARAIVPFTEFIENYPIGEL